MTRGCRTTGQIERQKKDFLESFAHTGNITESCEAVGVGSRSTIYRWQEHDDEFAALFREAEVQAVERLEIEARNRAVLGSEEPVYHQGEIVGHIRKKSDVLLIFLLKALNPAKYRERHDGPGVGEQAVKAVDREAYEAL